MKSQIFRRALVVSGVIAFSLFGCGKGSDTTTTVPQSSPPPSTTTPLTTTTSTSNVPAALQAILSASAPVKLTDSTQYTGLQDLAATIFPPLVGDPTVYYTMSGGRSSTVEGAFVFSFEDKQGLWATWTAATSGIPSFPGASIRTSSSIDMIFADDAVVIRTIASLSGDTMNGTIFYKIRVTGDIQCKAAQVCTNNNCTVTYDTNACRQYMNLSDSKVKSLGTYQSSYSAWVKN